MVRHYTENDHEMIEGIVNEKVKVVEKDTKAIAERLDNVSNVTSGFVDIANNTKTKLDKVDGLVGNEASLGTHPRTITTTVAERGFNLRDFNAMAIGGDDSASFLAAIDKVTNTRIKTLYVPDGDYNVSQRIVVPRGVILDFAPNAIVRPLANEHIFQMKPEAEVKGVTIDLREAKVDFDKACFYFDATDMFQFYEESHTLKNINIKGKRMTSGWKGTGILMEATKPDTYINNVHCNNITMTNIGKGIRLRVAPSIVDKEKPSWVNANHFHQVTIMNFEYALMLEGLSSIPRDVGGNIFSQLQLQAEAGSKRMIYCEGAYNRFSGFFWDLHKMKEENPAFEFAESSKFNEVKSAMAAELTESWWDKGYMNSFPSPNNYVADKRINAFPISLPYQPNFLGNQDDWMVNGDKRGFTIQQTSTHPVKSGELTSVFSFDSEDGAVFDMTNATYDNPVVLEIDLTMDPCWYAAFLSVASPWGGQPKGYEMDMFDSITNKWVGGVHWTKQNRSQAIAVSAPWAGADKCTKVRIKFWGSNLKDNTVKISRIMMTSTKDGGKAYLPFIEGSKLPDFTPRLPGDKIMIGDQDDILVAADKRYKVSSLGMAKSSGNIFSMFSMRREQFCKWVDVKQATPAIIEIDFGPNGTDSLESVGIMFAWAEMPTDIKIERVIGKVDNAYTNVSTISKNSASTIHVAARAPKTYKLKFTVWGFVNENKGVRVNRIFATSGDGIGTAFMNTEGDNKVFGDIMIADKTKGIVQQSPDGSYWRLSVSDLGEPKWTKVTTS
jgi:hypothetical protein